jgi:hypothetical protein
MIKSVSDPASFSVRSKAAAGLGELMKHQVSNALCLPECFADNLEWLTAKSGPRGHRAAYDCEAGRA